MTHSRNIVNRNNVADKFSSFTSIVDTICTKAVTKYEGPKFFLAVPKILSFSTLPAVETIFGTVKKISALLIL